MQSMAPQAPAKTSALSVFGNSCPKARMHQVESLRELRLPSPPIRLGLTAAEPRRGGQQRSSPLSG
jgi:hypothetical protein